MPDCQHTFSNSCRHDRGSPVTFFFAYALWDVFSRALPPMASFPQHTQSMATHTRACSVGSKRQRQRTLINTPETPPMMSLRPPCARLSRSQLTNRACVQAGRRHFCFVSERNQESADRTEERIINRAKYSSWYSRI